jgi:hypothetical protein
MWWRGVFEMGSWRSSNLLGVGFLVCEGLGMEGYIYHVQLCGDRTFLFNAIHP